MNEILLYLPFYLLGNLHCLGMCGPIAMMIGKSPQRMFYLGGRVAGFTVAGLICGAFGFVLTEGLKIFHLSALVSILMGCLMIMATILPLMQKFSSFLEPFNQKLTLLLLQNRPIYTFAFGFFTIVLPCGQSLIVYSICALSGLAELGALHGLFFSLCTTPALFFAFEMRRIMQKFYSQCNRLLATFTIGFGLMALARGFAELGAIPHFVLMEGKDLAFHIVLW